MNENFWEGFEKRAGIVKEAGIVLSMNGHTHAPKYVISTDDLGESVADGDKIGAHHAHLHGLAHHGAVMTPGEALSYAQKFRKQIDPHHENFVKTYYKRAPHAGEAERGRQYLHEIADEMESAAKSGKYKAFSLHCV